MLPRIIGNMIPQKRFIGTFQGIAPATAAKQTVVLAVTTAYNYVDLYLQCANLTAVMFQEIRLKIGGEVIQRWAGADLDGMNVYDKQPLFSKWSIFKIRLRRMALRGGLNVIDFNQKMFLSGSPRDLSYESSLNCGSAGGGFQAIQSVSIELDIIDTPAGQPTCQLIARVTAPVPGGPGAVLRVDKQSKQIAAGDVTITKSEMGLDALRPFVNRIILIPPVIAANTLTDFQLRYGTNDWWTVNANMLGMTQEEDNLHTDFVTAGTRYVLDFQEEGWGDTMLDMSSFTSDLLLKFTSANAGQLVYYVESVGLPFAQSI